MNEQPTDAGKGPRTWSTWSTGRSSRHQPYLLRNLVSGCWPARRVIGDDWASGVGTAIGLWAHTKTVASGIDRLVQALINTGSRIDPLIAKRAQRIVGPIATAFHEELDAQG